MLNMALGINKFIYIWIFHGLFAVDIGFAADTKDYQLAYEIALDINQNQDTLSHEEIYQRFGQIREAIQVSLLDVVPLTIPTQVNAALLKNTFCLGRLLEVSNQKCYQMDHKIIRENVHRLNYIDLARLSRMVFPSENVQNLIKIHDDAQILICRQHLIAHMKFMWERVLRTQDPHVTKFITMLLRYFPPKNSLDSYTDQYIDINMKKFISEYYGVKLDRRSIVKTYNRLFRHSCESHLLTPFKTLMMTYDNMNRNRVNMDHYRDIIWLYDLCSHLPIKIDTRLKIGHGRNNIGIETYMPARFNQNHLYLYINQ